LRVPVPGIAADSLREAETEGSSWYNGLEVSLTKRLSHGLQFLASYTFSKTLDIDGADINGTSAANTLTLGDQDSPAQRWGRASSVALSASSSAPPRRSLLQLMGWREPSLEIGLCRQSQPFNLAAPNASCFTKPPVIGADGIGTGFGNSGTGLVNGPGQANLDLAISKMQALPWLHEKTALQFRAEFFNAFNHPQFSNPDSNFSSPTFGVISNTSVSARVAQLALKLSF
jgi:hypothetical protein